MGSGPSVRYRAISARIRHEIAVNAGTASLIAFVSVIPFLPFVFQLDDGGLRLASRSSLLVAGAFVLVALLSRWAFFVFSLAYVPLTLVAIHIIRHFGGDERGWTLNQPDSRVEVILESPRSETIEYLQSFLWPSDWVLLFLSVLYLVVLGYMLRARHKLTSAARSAVALLLVVCIALLFHFRSRISADDWPQYQLANAAHEARLRLELLADRGFFLAQHPLPPADCTRRYEKIVIVIGESAVTDHMSAFGYHRKTTPFADRSSPYAFATLSPANLTRVSLAMMLTSAGPGDFGKFYESPSLVGQLRACGYETLWISNQGRVGRQDSIVTSVANEADRQVFLNELSYKDVKKDGLVIAELDRLEAFQATGQATFIHLIGSHIRYDLRYPRGFGFPRVRDRVDAYDNSILYTDFVLSQLYERFRSRGLLFVYVSDHGEVVSNGLHGHAFTPGYQEEFRAPLLIWTDDRAVMIQLQETIGTSRLNLESFDNVINFLVGSTDQLLISISGLVTSLSPGNMVAYERLRPFRRPEEPVSKPDQ